MRHFRRLPGSASKVKLAQNTTRVAGKVLRVLGLAPLEALFVSMGNPSNRTYRGGVFAPRDFDERRETQPGIPEITGADT